MPVPSRHLYKVQFPKNLYLYIMWLTIVKGAYKYLICESFNFALIDRWEINLKK